MIDRDIVALAKATNKMWYKAYVTATIVMTNWL